MESLSFKDIIHNDIKQTFLNLEEFGETHEVNGTPMTIDQVTGGNRLLTLRLNSWTYRSRRRRLLPCSSKMRQR